MPILRIEPRVLSFVKNSGFSFQARNGTKKSRAETFRTAFKVLANRLLRMGLSEPQP